ncbi:MAG TPA: AMP-binding protein, partial [Mycobacterium sp.]|nr:AMP-binding protein [Mycobacterium sp.]
RLDTVGRAAPGVRLRAVRPDGTAAPVGEPGEIWAAADSLMAGYLPDSATAEAVTDGWYHTGDIGVFDDGGWLQITDRSKEMIKVRGFQVAPAEVEAVLHGHPAVADCAVFGVPAGADGERVIAAVSRGAEVSAAELIDLVDSRLAGYKRPAEIVFVPEIPRLPSGKVLRRVLKERHGCPIDK